MQGNKVITVDDVTIRYNQRSHPAIEKVSFEVSKGTITTLIGPNGSGKTTLIKAILGLIDFEGEIKVFDKKIGDVYARVGFVPQRYNFDDDFPVSVGEFVGMPVNVLKNLSDDERSKRVRSVLNKVGSLSLAPRLLSEISGGQLQKVLLARTLVEQPELLILDEPESGVDVGGEQNLYDLLKSMVDKDGITVLVASHELDVVYTYADNVVCVNRKLVCAGKPHQVLNQKMFETLYGRELKFYGHEHH